MNMKLIFKSHTCTRNVNVMFDASYASLRVEEALRHQKTNSKTQNIKNMQVFKFEHKKSKRRENLKILLSICRNIFLNYN